MPSWDDVTEIATASLSSLGCLIIIISYILFPALRIFSGHVSLFLAVAGLGTASCLFIGTPKDDSALCPLQGFGFIYFANVTMATASYISYILHVVFVGGVRSSERVGVSRKVAISIWLVPLFLAGLPLACNKYHVHAEVSMCWIHSNGHEQAVALILQLTCFYIPLCVAMIFNVRTFSVLLPHILRATNTVSNSSALIRQAVTQVMWYPLILFVSYVFLVLIKILAVLGVYGSWAKKLMILSGCHGFLFSLVYMTLPLVRQRWMSLFSRPCGVGEGGGCLGKDTGANAPLLPSREAQADDEYAMGNTDDRNGYSSYNIASKSDMSWRDRPINATITTADLTRLGDYVVHSSGDIDSTRQSTTDMDGGSSNDDDGDMPRFAYYSNDPRRTLSTDSSLDSLIP